MSLINYLENKLPSTIHISSLIFINFIPRQIKLREFITVNSHIQINLAAPIQNNYLKFKSYFIDQHTKLNQLII